MRLVALVWSLLSLAAKRLWSRRWLMLCLLLGLVVAVGLLSSIPLYSDAAQNRLLQGKLQNAEAATETEVTTFQEPFSFLWRYIGAWNGNVEWGDYLPVQQYLSEQAPGVIGLPIKTQVRHVATDKLRLFPSEGAAFIPDEPLMWVNIGFITGLQDRVHLVEGDFPVAGQATDPPVGTNDGGEPVQVLVSQATAETLGLQVGESYTLLAAGTSGAQIPVQIVGVWRAIDSTDAAWFYQPDSFDEMLLTGEDAFTGQVVPALDTPVATAIWFQIFDGSRVRPATVSRIVDNVAIAEARVTALLNNTTLDASPVSALKSYGEAASTLTLVLTIFSLPIIGLVAYFISLIAGMVVQRGQSEIAILRSRGITRGQIVNLYLLEGLLLGGVGLGAGLLLGRLIAQLMSRTRTFLDLGLLSGSSSEPVAIVFTSTALFYGLVGVVLTLAAFLLPAFIASKHSIVTLRWEQARSSQAPVWQRYFLDIALLIPPFYGWYQMSRQGTMALVSSSSDPFSNPLLFLVPVLCFLCASFRC
jgi:putative ABC transport system permease protein